MCSYVLLTLNNRLLILKLHSYNRLLMLAYFTTLQFFFTDLETSV